MKVGHFFLICCIFLLLLIYPAAALEDSYEFNVKSGTNNLEFGRSYNGSFVSEMSGTLYEYTNMSGSHFQQITLTSSQAFDNSTIELVVPYNSFMKSDYADIRFYNETLNELPYYLVNYTATEAIVKIKENLTDGENIFYMSFGNPDAVSKSDEASVYIYFNDTPSNYGNITISPGVYDSLHVEFRPSTGANGVVRFYLNPTHYPYFGHYDTTTNGYFRYYATSSNASANLSTNTNRANLTVDLVRNIDGTSTIRVKNSSVENTFTSSQVNSFSQIRTDVRGVLTINKLIIYNTSSPSYSFGPIVEIEPESVTNISIAVPEGEFNSVSSNLPKSGVLDLNIYYEPHIALITADETTFDNAAILLFQPNPSTLSASFQIAIDQNFYGIVTSGISNGTINASLPPGSYYWRVQQPDGSWTEPRSFTIMPAPVIPGSLNFTIRNELTNATVSATVLISNETTTLQKTGSTITFNSSQVVAGNYSVRVNQTNYSARFYEVESPGNYTFYILPTNLTTNNASVVYFSLVDNTNQFQYNSTKLEIIKQTPNGSIVVTSNYFDASGFVVATLNQYDNYILKVVSDLGQERILGNYIQAGQQTVQLVIADISLKDTTNSTFGGFSYNLSKSEAGIKLEWLNQNESLLNPFEFYIYKDGDLVLNITSDAPFGSINYVENNSGLDPNSTYRIVFTANTTNGIIRVNEYYKVGGEAIGVDFNKIPTAVRIIISLCLLVLIASLFNITNAKFSAIAVTLVAAFLWFVGFLPMLPAVLIWMLFIAVVAYKTSG